MKNLLFCLGFAMFSAHTLDSMMQADWRLVLPGLPEEAAIFVYVVGHIPLVALLVWLTNHHSNRVRSWSRRVFCAFLVLHIGIHKGLENHPQYTFSTQLSIALIYLPGLVGLLYLVVDGLSLVLQWKSEGSAKEGQPARSA